MTARTHETIRVGLRRIIRDQSVRPNMRMEAIRLLMRVEGLMEEGTPPVSQKNKPAIAHVIDANDKELLELLALAEEQKPG